MKKLIRVRPDNVYKLLDDIDVGRASSAYIVIAGVPREMEGVQIHVGRPGTVATTAVRAVPRTNWTWMAYISPLHFPLVGAAEYHVTAVDDRGNTSWLGRGRLVVMKSVQNVDTLPIVPDDTYLRNPETGLWHRLTVSFEDGVLTPSVSETGVER